MAVAKMNQTKLTRKVNLASKLTGNDQKQLSSLYNVALNR